MKRSFVFFFLAVLAAAAGAQTITNSAPPVLGFIDVSPAGTNTGTPIASVSDDGVYSVTTVTGNGLFPAGITRIGNNGYAMSQWTGATVNLTNAAIPPTGLPVGVSTGANSYLMAFWDDLDPFPDPSSATIYVDDGISVPGVLIIMWKNDGHFSNIGLGESITFEIQVFSAAGAGSPWIQYVYPDATFGGTMAANDAGLSATVGYVDGTNAVAVNNAQWSFGTASVPDGSTISIFPPDFIGTGLANPATVFTGSATLLTVSVSALINPPMPPIGVTVTVDLTSIGGIATQQMYDDGTTAGDVTAGDDTFSFALNILSPPGNYTLPWSAIDSSARATTGTISLQVAAANDICATATPLSLGANPTPAANGNTFSNIGATSDTLGYPATCAAILNDIWFSFTPAVSDTYVFDTNTPCGFTTAGTMTNTTIALYPGSACGAPGAALACDADSGVGSLSLLQAALTAGNTYYLRVGATTNVFQTFYVNVRQGALGGNNECLGAIPVVVGTNPAPAASCKFFSCDAATTSAGWPAICATIVNDVWFSFTPPSTGQYVINTKTPCGFVAGTATNTTLAVYATVGCAVGAPIACNGDAGNNTLSQVNPTLTFGTTYYIRVGVTAATGAGTFYLNVTSGSAIPANDVCATATPVVIGTNPAPAASCNTFTNEFATSDVLGYPAVCGTIVNDVWFAFTPAIGGDFRIDTETPTGFTAGSNTDSTVAVYSSCGLGAPIACDTDSGVTGNGLMSVVTANGLASGTTYYIRVGSTSTTTAGTFYLNINRIFSLVFTSPFGPGSLRADIVAGPASKAYFLAVTLNAGGFPMGWLYGVDMPIAEAVTEINTGFPFTGLLNANGDITIGPFSGLPPGGVLTIYAVVMGFGSTAIDFPTVNTAAKSYTIP